MRMCEGIEHGEIQLAGSSWQTLEVGGRKSEVGGQRTENNFEFRNADCEFGICEDIEYGAWGME